MPTGQAPTPDGAARKAAKPFPPLLRLLITLAAAGALVGLAVVGTLLALDVGRLRTLAVQAGSGGVVIYMMVIAFMATFGSAAMGFGVMRAARPPQQAPRG
jgi:hypothetical protein